MAQLISINPATEEVLAKFDYLSEQKAIEETKKSRAAFVGWGSLVVSERCTYLKKAATVLIKNKTRYAKLITLEMGKPIRQSVAEVEKCALVCEYYAENAQKFLQDQNVPTQARKSYVSFEPLGVILGIMPWNYPFWQVFRFAAATLAAGNTILVKHSSNVPQCAIAIEEVFKEAGFPDYVYRNLLLSSDTVKSLIAKDLIDGISLTGSTEAGSKVGELAGKNLKKVVLELGGSDPFIVLDDGDLKKAAEVAVTARFQNTGQTCAAAKRFIIHESVSKEFIELFVNGIRALKIGDPFDPNNYIGPLARKDLRDSIEKQLSDAVSKGGKILIGGKKVKAKGYFFEPTAIQVSKNSPLATTEETFGPVASIIIVKDDKDAIEIANSSPYGLGSVVWTNDQKRADQFIQKLKCGIVVVNGMVKSDPRIPFGGIKKSGLGRELGSFGILEFANVKSVMEW